VDTTGFPVVSVLAAGGDQQLACSGTDCLLVWTDTRNAGYDVYGSRIDAAVGSTVGADDIPISTAGYDQMSPSVACAGTACMAVAGPPAGRLPHRRTAPIDRAGGTVVDSDGIPITPRRCSLTQPNQFPVVAFAPSHWLIARQDYLPERDVRRPPTRHRHGDDPDGIFPALAPTPSEAGRRLRRRRSRSPGWTHGPDPWRLGNPVDATAAAVDAAAAGLTSYADRVAVGAAQPSAWSGAGRAAAPVNGDVYAVRADRSAGLVVDGGIIPLAISGNDESWPAVACAGDDCGWCGSVTCPRSPPPASAW
jgi:hypothetical protein